MYADLTSRACGFAGVFIAMCVLGFTDGNEFIITPQTTFTKTSMYINTASAEPTEENTAGQTERKASEDTEIQDSVIESVKEQKAPEQAPARPEENNNLPQIKSESVKQEPDKVKQLNETKNEPKTLKKAEEIKQEHVTAKKSSETKKKSEVTKKTDEIKKKTAPVKQSADLRHRAESAQKTRPASSGTTQHTTDNRLAAENTVIITGELVSEIRRKLRYPRNAVRRKLEGVVNIDFTVKDGKITSFTISKKSGHRILDDAAAKLAAGLIGFVTDAGAVDCVITVPVKYELI